MENQTIEWLIKNRLAGGQLEGETSRVWNSILQIEFPVSTGYTTGPETQIQGRRADLFTAHFVFENQAKEYKFFIVECKAPGLETESRIWADALEQLNSYPAGISTSRHGKRKFGAIAVGKVVQFYEWNKETETADALDNGTSYYIDRQCQTVTGWLRYFRENHQ